MVLVTGHGSASRNDEIYRDRTLRGLRFVPCDRAGRVNSRSCTMAVTGAPDLRLDIRTRAQPRREHVVSVLPRSAAGS